MYKLQGKTKPGPLLHPSPDLKNRSKINGTASPVRQVKLFLQNVKNGHRGTLAQSAEEKSRYSSEDVLRKRINELQLENNEYRSLTSDYELLVERNKNLQAQMLLLLDELEDGGLEGHDHSLSQHHRMHSKEQNTTESSHQQSPPRPQQEDSAYFGHSSPSQQIKIVNAFDSSDEHEDIIEENRRLREENARVQELIDNSVREAITKLQQKFMAYVKALEEKLDALITVNLQATAQMARDDSSKSSLQNYRVRERKESASNDASQKSGFSLNPRKTLELQLLSKQKEQNQGSKVDIKLSYLSESSRSFGNNHNSKYPPHNTPNSFFKNVEFIDSETPAKTLFHETPLEQAFHQLAILRTYISACFSDTTTHPLHAHRALQAELKDLLATYFSPIQMSSLEEQNAQLRKRLAQVSGQASKMHSLRFEGSAQRPASEVYLQQSYYLSLQPQSTMEFEQSKRKLSEVIDVVRTFNRDYRHLLSESSRSSLLLQSANNREQS